MITAEGNRCINRRSLSPGTIIKGGYSSWSIIFVTLFNLALAGVLIFLSLPFFLVIGVAVWGFCGRPVIYKGERMGLHKKPFIMYKFRTLPVGAQQIIKADLLSYHHGMLTSFTKFLRDTRLDELPQLFNIVKGDMNFIGPRPMRLEVYEKNCMNIPDLDLRFLVKPGLIGFSQLFTPHSTPKRIRSKIDNHLIHRRQDVAWALYLIVLTIGVVLKEVAVKSYALTRRHIKIHVLKLYNEMRLLDRVPQKQALVKYKPADIQDAEFSGDFHLIDINEEYFKMTGQTPLSGPVNQFLLERVLRKNNRKVVKKARLYGEIFKTNVDEAGRHDYVICYRPATDLNQFKVEHYFLKKSFG